MWFLFTSTDLTAQEYPQSSMLGLKLCVLSEPLICNHLPFLPSWPRATCLPSDLSAVTLKNRGISSQCEDQPGESRGEWEACRIWVEGGALATEKSHLRMHPLCHSRPWARHADRPIPGFCGFLILPSFDVGFSAVLMLRILQHSHVLVTPNQKIISVATSQL